jgi:hypothetical protein
MSLDEWLRVGNQDIQEKSTGTKEKFWGLRGGMCPLSTPPGSAPGHDQRIISLEKVYISFLNYYTIVNISPNY